MIRKAFIENIFSVSLIQDKNEEKIEEARALYWEAVKYPRKKKKELRKKAKQDFIFWSSLNEHFKQLGL